MARNAHQYNPNSSYDINEEYTQGVSGRPGSEVFSFDSPRPISPLWFYGVTGYSFNFCRHSGNKIR
jgi:hypothetical protein